MVHHPDVTDDSLSRERCGTGIGSRINHPCGEKKPMALIIKLLCARSVNGLQTLYSATSPTSAIVSNVRLVNGGGSAVTANVYFHAGGGQQYRISQKDYSLPAGEILTVKPELTLAAGDYIESSTSAAVDAVVCGAERQ